MVILNNLVGIGNSEIVNSLSNIAQFYNIYQSTKSANYAQMVSELQKQNYYIDSIFDTKTHEILNEVMLQTDKIIEQNQEILEQNEKIISLLEKRNKNESKSR